MSVISGELLSALDDTRVARSRAAAPGEWYSFGRGALHVAADDDVFRERFRRIFGECRCDPEAAMSLVQGRLHVRTILPAGVVEAELACPEPIDLLALVMDLFSARDLTEVPSVRPGWRMLAERHASADPVLAFKGDRIVAPRGYGWQAVMAHCGVIRVMTLQKDMVFFHAASAAIGDKGVLIFGNKGAGKTTLSLALAERGHAFLGDEYAAVSATDRQLVPFRRTASIREGVRPGGVDEFLAGRDCDTEINIDGTRRVRAAVGEMFPAAAVRPAQLTHAFFLRRLSARPEVERFTPRVEDLPLLAPLLCTVWGMSAGQLSLKFLRLLSGTRCFYLSPGGLPEDTAELIERTVEDECQS